MKDKDKGQKDKDIEGYQVQKMAGSPVSLTTPQLPSADMLPRVINCKFMGLFLHLVLYLP
jgi:hypothetical protein